MSKIVIALGGNALGKSPKEQLTIVKETAKPIVDLIERGHEVIIAHGNGPQVGMINLAMETAAQMKDNVTEMPFPECGAMSQGYIGYHLQNAMREELLNRKLETPVVTIVSQVLVDADDKAFINPTKPIGSFYTKAEAEQLREEKNYTIIEDSGRGYRRVVPSPIPIDIIEKRTIKHLVNDGQIVIAVGGGGIPVISKDNKLIGVPAVIDKDFASSKLAEIVDADFLFILTAVDRVAVNFGKTNQKDLDRLSITEANQYIEEEQFAPGSMLPKVEAAMAFAKSKKGRKSIIASLSKTEEALNGDSGTLIYMD